MLNKILAIFRQPSEDRKQIQRNREEIEKLRAEVEILKREVGNLSRVVESLMGEVQRNKEREAFERRRLSLRIEDKSLPLD